jgi:hypothetical protein
MLRQIENMNKKKNPVHNKIGSRAIRFATNLLVV